MTRGLVTHVQRFSVHDGPGIRTTVFLKGCQMRCAWCHNPETFHPRRELQFVAARCIGCGECVARCEHDARRTSARHTSDDGPLFDRALCVGCGRCAETCYARALVLLGREALAEEILAEVVADREFYANSGGGLTLSGGEPLCQPQFALEILRLCKNEGIHTALETNLAVPWSTVVPFLPVVDLFMIDIKIFDDALHRQWTGMSNRSTIKNIKLLAKEQKQIIARTPVIAGLNDSPEQIAPIAELLAGMKNIMYYELLPYHPLGVGKYESLGLEPPPSDWQPPGEERLRVLAELVRNAGLEVRVAGHGMDKLREGEAPAEPGVTLGSA